MFIFRAFSLSARRSPRPEPRAQREKDRQSAAVEKKKRDDAEIDELTAQNDALRGQLVSTGGAGSTVSLAGMTPAQKRQAQIDQKKREAADEAAAEEPKKKKKKKKDKD